MKTRLLALTQRDASYCVCVRTRLHIYTYICIGVIERVDIICRSSEEMLTLALLIKSLLSHVSSIPATGDTRTHTHTCAHTCNILLYLYDALIGRHDIAITGTVQMQECVPRTTMQ